MNQQMTSRWTSSYITSLCDFVNVVNINNQLLVCNINEFENKILCNFEHDWSTKINQFPKLRVYKEIKLNFGTEHCLLINLPKPYRSILAQFR